MVHKVIHEVKHADVNEADFSKWVHRISDHWQAEVIHENDGELVQHFDKGSEVSAVTDAVSLEEWISEEFAEANREFAESWQEVGRLLESRNLSMIEGTTKSVVNN